VAVIAARPTQSAAETDLGKIVVVSGQGEGKRAVVTFDPRWLEERLTSDDLTNGPAGWTQFGDDGIRVEATANGNRVVAISVKADGPCGALWNFPALRPANSGCACDCLLSCNRRDWL